MKKVIIIIVALVAVVAVVAGLLATSYNGFVNKDEAVKTAESAIAVQLQRRANLIPNFVEVTKGYSEYEKSTFTAVTEARTKLSSASGVKEQANANAELDKAIDIWLNAVTEAYPELRANEMYIELQTALEGTENRIAVARKDYNDAAVAYNKAVRSFPGSIVAAIFGFEQAEYFVADESANKVPQVSFD